MVRDGYFYGFRVYRGRRRGVADNRDLALGSATGTAGLVLFWFFRDPQRSVPSEPGLVVSPADGKVTEVARIQTPGGELIRLSIFLSVFDVHVNRSPIAGTVREVRYQKGKYLNALNPESAEKNEQNLVTVQGDEFDVIFSQIAGILARRIVFRFQVGDFVERGQRVGLIKFGSRVDVLLPGHAHVRVAMGQRVKGGASVLADIHPPEDDPSLEVLQESFA